MLDPPSVRARFLKSGDRVSERGVESGHPHACVCIINMARPRLRIVRMRLRHALAWTGCETKPDVRSASIDVCHRHLAKEDTLLFMGTPGSPHRPQIWTLAVDPGTSLPSVRSATPRLDSGTPLEIPGPHTPVDHRHYRPGATLNHGG